ncbi:GNAT family N-acetyltransferase [Enterovibrio makurazakiensis]|uniref:GNAT family N-acetyltransferase n=1 Tax=Enterovibrio makurazakiensis TaxID=2910232 RepID=UPI003D1ECF18
MDVSLKAMSAASFSAYLKWVIPVYASDNVASGRWDQSDALERAKMDYARLLPKGLNSPDDHLFNIIENASNINVGYIWVKIETHFGKKSAFIYDVGIFEGHRRKGFAKSALRCIETVASELGASSLGLHVFSHNSAAQALYSSMGYQVVSHNMKKKLSR